MGANAMDMLAPRPRTIGALREGFDAVANHIGLIILPVVLDLFLWLAPHFQLKNLVAGLQTQMSEVARLDPQFAKLVEANQEFWTFVAEKFNLAMVLRTYPIGLPSLMAGTLPVDSPLGGVNVVQVPSLGLAILIWLGFCLAGILLGSLYFSQVARTILAADLTKHMPTPLWATGQVVVLTIIMVGLFLLVSIPAVLLLSVLAMVSAAVAQIALLLFSLVLAWLLLPLLFSPHGIFLFRQRAVISMLSSVRLVRFILPTVSIFLLAIVLLSQGLDLLWEVPSPASWMSLVAILGHAFIATSLLAASFVFYRDAVRWVQEFRQRTTVVKG